MTVGLPVHEREAVVAEANRAPSVHNVQPVRWAFAPGEVRLRLDPARALPVGDPEGYDVALSLGCALEATRIALARRGLGAEIHIDPGGRGAKLRLREATAPERGGAERDHARMERRRTHRLGFAPATDADRAELERWAADRDDIALATDETRKNEIAAINDAASLQVLRDDAYRAELLGWMRLHPGDPRVERDGLGASALGMARPVAWGARIVLGRSFGLLDRLGLAGGITTERRPTLAAAGIAAITMPREAERPTGDIGAGLAFVRAALELVALDHQTWPMGVLVDDDRARERTARLLRVPPDRTPRIVLRVGRAVGGAVPAARLPASGLID